MPERTLGDAVSINWTTEPLPKVGDFYVSPRSAYLIGLVRQRNTRDGSIKAHVRAMRIDPDTIPARVKKHEMGFVSRDPIAKK